MGNRKGYIPWNKGVRGYSFKKDVRLGYLTSASLESEIKRGLSKSELMICFNVSEPTIYKYVARLPKLYKAMLYKNGRRKNKEAHQTEKYRSRMSNIFKGRNNHWLKGRTYEEILGSKSRAKQRSEKTSQWMRTEQNIRKYCRKVSKPQRALYERIKARFPSAELEYPVVVSESRIIWLDIAVPNMKIDYEYDGAYWHRDKSRDEERDKILSDLGWIVHRIKE